MALTFLQCYATTTNMIPEHFANPKRNSYLFIVILHLPLLPALGNHKSTFHDYEFDYFGYFI